MSRLQHLADRGIFVAALHEITPEEVDEALKICRAMRAAATMFPHDRERLVKLEKILETLYAYLKNVKPSPKT